MPRKITAAGLTSGIERITAGLELLDRDRPPAGTLRETMWADAIVARNRMQEAAPSDKAERIRDFIRAVGMYRLALAIAGKDTP